MSSQGNTGSPANDLARPTDLIFEVRQNAEGRHAVFAAFTYFGDAEAYAIDRSERSPNVVVSIESHRDDYDVVWRKYERGVEVFTNGA